MTSKAPAGGIVSAVNGQFYAGGEFTPLHGLYCGKIGAKRKKAVEKFAAVNRVFGDESAGRVFTVSVWDRGSWLAVGVAFATSHKEAEQMVSIAVSGRLSATEIA